LQYYLKFDIVKYILYEGGFLCREEEKDGWNEVIERNVVEL